MREKIARSKDGNAIMIDDDEVGYIAYTDMNPGPGLGDHRVASRVISNTCAYTLNLGVLVARRWWSWPRGCCMTTSIGVDCTFDSSLCSKDSRRVSDACVENALHRWQSRC